MKCNVPFALTDSRKKIHNCSLFIVDNYQLSKSHPFILRDTMKVKL